MTLGVSWTPNGTTTGIIGSIVLGPAVNGRGAVLGAVVAVLGAVVAVSDAILTPFWVCTTKSCWANRLDVLTSNLSLKSSPLTWEEISDAGPELEAERAGLDIIHASSWGKAAVQCCSGVYQGPPKPIPLLGRPSPTDGTGVMNIKVTLGSHYSTLRAWSVVVMRGHGPFASPTNVRHYSCK